MKVRSKKLNFYSDRIEVRIEGFQIGKLLDAAAKSGMLLKAIRVDSKTAVRAEIAACDLKQLQKLAGARYRVTPQVRRGVVYQTRALLRRPMLVIGVLLAASMVIAESFFVAAVTIDGYRAIPESALRDCLAASGVREERKQSDLATMNGILSLIRTKHISKTLICFHGCRINMKTEVF